jgi:putative membrane protein
VLIVGGLAVVILATTRFVRTTWLLDDPQLHSASSVRAELVLCACLVLVVSSYTLYLALR